MTAHPIAERTVQTASGPLRIQIRKPVTIGDGEVRCVITIASGTREERINAGGLDSVQSLLLALVRVGYMLDERGATFLGGHHGFPVFRGPGEAVFRLGDGPSLTLEELE